MLAQAGVGADPAGAPRLRGAWQLLARAACAILALLAIGIFLASIPAGLAHLGVVTEAERAAHPFDVSLEAEYLLDVVGLLASVVATSICFILAVLIFYRRPDHPLGLLTSLFLVIYAITLAGPLEFLLADEPAPTSPLSLIYLLIVPLLALFLYLFPDGRFVPSWVRWLAIALVPWTLPTLVVTDLRIQSVQGASSATLGLQVLWYMALPTAGVLAQFQRYRRAAGTDERQQTKWVVFGFAASMFLMVVPMLPFMLFPPPEDAEGMRTGVVFFGRLLWYVTLLLIPLSMSVAVLRYRLWDIDLIINRALVYGGLTASVVGIYVLVVGLLSGVFEASGDRVVSLLATGLVAVLLNPLRERLQRGVNHLMYGDRDDPYVVVSRLGRRLEATIAPEAVLPTIVETVAQALKLPYTAIVLKYGDEFQLAAEYARDGAKERAELTVPLAYQGETIGQLLLAARGAGETFTPADHRLLEDLARQAGVAAHAVRLTADLQRSRQRLVAAREEERRRIRRDLHDGLGPMLASLSLKLDAARNLLGHDPAAADTLLLELKGQAQTALADIRRLVYDLRPPALDQLGLVSALREHAAQYGSNGLHVSVEAPEHLPPLPAAVEVAAYRIALEALTNVTRHAGARHCLVRLSLDGALSLEVADDGTGLPTPGRSGVGLASMRERAAELGGSCTIESVPSGGTRVLARLPLPAES